MPSLYAFALALLATTAAAAGLQARQTDCSSLSSNFQMIANTTSGLMYGQLGFPCITAGCGVYFSIDQSQVSANYTFYAINSKADLVIVANNQPSQPIGDIAYYYNNGFVYFGKPKIIKNDGLKKPKCSIEPDVSGDGSCNLVCTEKRKGGLVVAGDFVQSNDYNHWAVGNADFEPIVIKAIAPKTS